MTLWTPCSAQPLLSTKSKALCAPCCWWRGRAYEAGPGGPARPCPGSAMLHSLLFPPCPLLVFERLQHQSSSPLSTIPNRVEVAKQEALLKTLTQGLHWVGGWMISFSRKRTLAYYSKPTPPIQKWMSLIIAKKQKVQLKNINVLSHFNQVNCDLRKLMAGTTSKEHQAILAYENRSLVFNL